MSTIFQSPLKSIPKRALLPRIVLNSLTRFKQRIKPMMISYQFYYFIKRLIMWKAVGSVHSGDDKSVRSITSRQDLQFQPFRHKMPNSPSGMNSSRDRSFCYDYLKKKKKLTRNMSSNLKINLQTTNFGYQTINENMFNSTRKIERKQKMIDRNEVSKNNSFKLSKGSKQKNYTALAITFSNIYNLKKDHMKLTQTLSNEFINFKNMFYQMEEVMHERKAAEEEFNDKDCGQNTQEAQQITFAKGILTDAINIKKYFAQMDLKKADIIKSLSNQ